MVFGLDAEPLVYHEVRVIAVYVCVHRANIHGKSSPHAAAFWFRETNVDRNMLQDALELANASKMKPDIPRSERKVREKRLDAREIISYMQNHSSPWMVLWCRCHLSNSCP